jgi:hypothetical protein
MVVIDVTALRERAHIRLKKCRFVLGSGRMMSGLLSFEGYDRTEN